MKQSLAMVLIVLVLASSGVQADSKYFSYGAGTNIWDTASAYWGTASGGPYNATWSSNDAAFFEGTAGTVALSGGQAANSVSFNVAGYTISNATLTLNSPAVVSNDFAATISSVIAGSAGLAKAGSSTLTLIGANTYSGGTTVNNGTLQVGNGSVSGTFGSGTYTVSSNATLRLSVPSANSARPTWANISGAGTLSLNTANLGTANGDWNAVSLPAGFAGTLQIQSGRAIASGSGNQGLGGAQQVIVQPNGQLGVWLGGTVTQNCVIAGTGYGEGGYEAAIRMSGTTMTGNMTLSTNATLATAGSSTLTGALSGVGPAALTFGTSSLNGTVVLSGSGPNTYSGLTTVNYGNLVLSKNAGVVAVPGDITMNSAVTTMIWMTQNGQLGGNGILTISGSGAANTWFFLNGTAQSLAGIVEADANRNGVVENSQSGVGPGVNANPGTLTLTGSGSYSYNGYLRNYDGGALTIIKTGSGTQTFVGDRIGYSGATVVNSGRLVYSGIGYSSSLVTINSGAVFEMNIASSFVDSATSTITGNGTWVKSGAGTIRWGTQAGTFLLGPGSLIDIQGGGIDAGSSANENWSGNQSSLNITNGASIAELTYGNAQFDALTGGGGLSGAGGGSLVLGVNNTASNAYNSAGVATFSGVISSIGPLVKNGTGTQVLSGINTYTSTTTINGGKLVVDGAIGTGLVTVNYGGQLGGTGTIGGSVIANVGGGISPGNGLNVTTVSNLTLSAGSVNIFDFDGTPTNDLLVVARSGGLTNNGTTFLLYSNGTATAWIPTLGTPYTLIQYSGPIAGSGGYSVANPLPGLSYTFTTNGGFVSVTFGGSSVWNGGGADNYWKTAGNWSGVGVTNNAALVFDGNVRTVTTNDFIAGTPFSILFTNTADAFTLSGNAITLAGDVVNLSPNGQTINNAATLTTLRTFNAIGGDLTINGFLSGVGGVTKAGPGNMMLTAANTYSGITSISGGKLLLTNGSALQSSTLDYNNYGGVLSFGSLTNVVVGALSGNQDLALTNDSAAAVSLSVGNNTATYGGSLSGSGALIKIGAGIQVLSGASANTYTGMTVVGGSGRLALGKTAGVVAIPGDIVCTNSGNPYLYMLSDNQLGGNGVLTYVGSGAYTRVELGNTAQSVAGIVDATGFGIVQHQEGSAANSAGTGTLTLTGSGNYTFAGYLRNANGVLAVTKNGTGTQTLSGAQIIYMGATFLNAGVLNFDGGNSGSSTPITLNGGTLSHKGAGYRTMGGLLTVAVDSTIVVTNSGASNPLFFDAGIAGSGNLTITNSGAATVGVNFRNTPGSFTGALTVNGGQVGISSGAGLALANSDVTLAGAALNLTAIFGDTATDATVKSLTGNSASSVVLGAQRLTIGGGSGSFVGLVGGTGGITKSGIGTQAFSGTNTYTGATIINGGTLAVNSSLAAGSAVSVASGGTLGGTGNVAGIVSVASGGHVAPGYGIGSITNGGLGLAAGGLFDVEFDLANAQTNDQIIVTGSGSLTMNGGAFNLYSNGTNSAWTTPGTYSLIQYSGVLGGSGVAGLLVNNPAPNRSYTFSASGGWVVVTVGVTTGSVWSGSSAVDSKWQTATNWTGNVAPNPGDVLTFAGSTRLANTNDYAATTFGGINFSAGSSAFVLAGNPLTLSGAVNNYSTTAQTLALSVTSSPGGLTVNTISGNVTANSGISGSDGLIKSGSYTLTLSGNNAYTYGDTTIAAGTLEIGGTAQLGAGTYSGAITNNGAILVNCTTNQTLLGAISGIGSVTKSNTGTLTLAGANSYSGVLTLNAGKLIVTGPNIGSSDTTLNGGTIALSGGDNRLPIGSSMSFSGTSTLDVGGINQTILNVTVNNGVTATVAGSGGTLNVNGSSNIILANGPGVTTVLNLNGLTASFTNAAGTIYGAYNNSSSGSGANSTILVNGATLTATQIVVANGSYTGGANAPPVAGTLTVTAGSLKVDTLTLANRYWASGSVTVNLNNGGTISARLIARGSDSANWGITRTINWNDGTIANYNANTDLTIESLPGSYGATMTLASTGTHAFAIGSGRQGIVNQVISGAGSLTKVGSGTLTLNAVNTYSGATVVAEGVLRPGVAVNTLSTNGSIVMAGGTLDARSYTNLVGTLTASAGSSTIWMATNVTATLQFRDSSATNNIWTGGVSLVGTLNPQSVRFGTSRSGLRPDQLGLMNYQGKRVTLDDQGYVVLARGTLIMVQ